MSTMIDPAPDVLSDQDRRRSAVLRHHLRTATHRIVRDCELLLADTGRPEWRLWREAVGDALLAGHQLRAQVDGRFPSPDVVVSAREAAALHLEMRGPQKKVVQAMTSLLCLVPTELSDELLMGDARAIRDLALQLGSDDSVVMPVATRVSRPVAPPRVTGGAALAAAESARQRILVVDDAEAGRKMLVQLLERLGYDVAAAEDGLAALAIAERESIDVILSDIRMPNCDGFELLRRLKGDDSTRDIPVIMVSGQDDRASVVKCIEQGAEDHISKPIDRVLLQARVRASLDRKRLRDLELAYLRRVAQLTLAAEAVESDTYEPGHLEPIANEDDALGRLARKFDQMVSGMRSKEAQLQFQLKQLKGEIRQSRNSGRPSGLFSSEGTLVAGELLAERYEILEQLGIGGMGVVYRAHDRKVGEDVAVKVVRSELVKADPTLIERLRMEIRLARRITHPNVVRTHDLGEGSGTYFLTMEYVKGITVSELLETRGRLTVASALAIGVQLADALAVAHEQQVIHRDIKPANLLVDEEGVLKVMDFGLARHLVTESEFTLHGTVVGTPRYMAPEQLLGGEVNAQSDLFAVGVVLYECMTGSRPFDGNSALAIVARMLDGPPTPMGQLVPEVPPALAALVESLLQYEPSDRPGSARELADRLRALS